VFIKNSDKTAIVWRDLLVSYRDLLSHIHFFATLFPDRKSGKVVIFAPNSPEWVYAFYAAWKNHCIAVPIDFLSSSDEVAYILNDCQPEVVFCATETQGVLNQALEQVHHEVRVFVFEEQRYDLGDYSPEEIDPPDTSETAAIIYTSGTTNSPKGVMLSYDNMLANVFAVSREIPIFTPDRTVLALLPFHHVFPLLGSLVAPLYVGAPIAFSPSMVSHDIITTLSQNGVGIIIGVPRLYAAIRAGIMEKINKSFAARTMFKLAKLVHSRAFSPCIDSAAGELL